VHGGDGVVEAVAPLTAVAEDLPAKVCSTRALTRRCSALSSSCPRRRGRPALLRCGTISPVPRWAPAAITVVPATAAGRSDSRQTWASALLPGAGWAEAMIRRVSASMMTCTFAENR
jgi:hypothetical protein